MPEKRIEGWKTLEEGTMKKVEADSEEFLLTKVDGEIHILGAKCPHYGAPLEQGLLNDGRIVCPWHHACFNARTGDLLEPPALDSLPCYRFKKDGEGLIVQVPDESSETRPVPMASLQPSHANQCIAIVGAGAAGSRAAESLRQNGWEGRILLISGESDLPYDRPNCSKGLLSGEAKDEWMPLRSEKFYQENGIERQIGRVVDCNIREKAVRFENGAEISPQGILLAMGGRPKTLDVPGVDLKEVVTLRSWKDTRRILDLIENASNIVVVGASFIGMEVAASLRERGKNVTVLSPEETPFLEELGEPVGKAIQKLHEKNGTKLALGSRVREFRGDDHLKAVVSESGDVYNADVAIVGIGVEPPTDLVEGVELNKDGSLNVDETLRFADDVYAAGDIARYPSAHTGGRVRIEHWRLAQQHGTVAGENLLGGKKAFTGVPFFWTRQFGSSIGVVGYPNDRDETVMTGNGDGSFTAYFIKEDRLVAAAGKQTDNLECFSELMRTNRLPSPKEILADKSPDLSRFL